MNSAALSEIAGELLVTVRELREELIQVRPGVLYIFEENTGSCLAKLCTVLPSVANPDPGSCCFFSPWIRDPKLIFSRSHIVDPKPIFLRV
jgi:hypothetical protein